MPGPSGGGNANVDCGGAGPSAEGPVTVVAIVDEGSKVSREGARTGMGKGQGAVFIACSARSRSSPDNLVWVVVGDRAKIEAPIRQSGLGEMKFLDANGKSDIAATSQRDRLRGGRSRRCSGRPAAGVRTAVSARELLSWCATNISFLHIAAERGPLPGPQLHHAWSDGPARRLGRPRSL
jgi:hypothetical protein